MRRGFKTALCTAVVLGACPAIALGQAWSDGFETYPEGPLVGQGGWEAWDGDPGAAGFVVTTMQSHTGDKAVAVTGVDDAVHQYGAISGVWRYRTWVYVPSDVGGDGDTYFIMLNVYTSGGDPKNWAMQLNMDVDAGTITDTESAGTAELLTDQWVEINAVIDLIGDNCQILYNNGFLANRPWVQDEGSAVAIGAVDLWGDSVAGNVYYDDMALETVPPVGACCFPDGSCTDSQPPGTCDADGGVFQGFGSLCLAADCPIDGPNGWIVDAPIEWFGTTCEDDFGCNLAPGRDTQWEVTIPWAAPWTFSVCNASTTWDTQMFLGSEGCTSDLGANDDSCGLQSEITVELEPGTYFLDLDGFNQSACGSFQMTVSAPCIVTPDPGATDEGEAVCADDFVDTFNGGCNSDPPVFSTMACDEIITGTTGNFLVNNPPDPPVSSRDTDWYTVTFATTTEITYKGRAEVDFQMLVIADTAGDCVDTPILDFAQPDACSDATIVTTLDAGTYYLWAGAQSPGGTAPCGSVYEISLTCEEVVVDCPGDIDESGDIGFGDLLFVLSNWGAPGGPGDIDGSGDVGFGDLLFILSNWGPCP